jgi:hypothetical protein
VPAIYLSAARDVAQVLDLGHGPIIEAFVDSNTPSPLSFLFIPFFALSFHNVHYEDILNISHETCKWIRDQFVSFKPFSRLSVFLANSQILNAV